MLSFCHEGSINTLDVLEMMSFRFHQQEHQWSKPTFETQTTFNINFCSDQKFLNAVMHSLFNYCTQRWKNLDTLLVFKLLFRCRFMFYCYRTEGSQPRIHREKMMFQLKSTRVVLKQVRKPSILRLKIQYCRLFFHCRALTLGYTYLQKTITPEN